jgi:hypothetical protein
MCKSHAVRHPVDNPVDGREPRIGIAGARLRGQTDVLKMSHGVNKLKRILAVRGAFQILERHRCRPVDTGTARRPPIMW